MPTPVKLIEQFEYYYEEPVDIRVVREGTNTWLSLEDVLTAMDYSVPLWHLTLARHQWLKIVNQNISYDDAVRFATKSKKAAAGDFLVWLMEKLPAKLEEAGREPPEDTKPTPSLPSIEGRFFEKLLPEYDNAVALCKLVGHDDVTAKLNAVEALKLHYGVDVAEYTKGLGVIPTAKKESRTTYNARELGKKLNWSAVEVNQELKRQDLMWQETYVNGKGDSAKRWRLTGKGMTYGVELLTGKVHSDGKPIVQIRWYPQVVTIIAPEYQEHLDS